jgi:hypothetical protein
MSYAYDQLRLALQYLTQSAPLHERLAKALTESLCLRPKDLPTACRKEFLSLLNRLSVEHTTKRNTGLALKIKAMSDQEVHAITHTLLHLYDTVTRYQPLPPVEACSK